MGMKNFAHVNAATLDQASAVLRDFDGKAAIIAGGTDLLGKMKDEILPVYPQALVNIRCIPGLEYIRELDGKLLVGALTRLADIAASERVRSKYPALAQAAGKTASPQIRQMGTIAGNICQDIRCWYYRNPSHRFPCMRKGGGRCYAIKGDNRYHSIFGGSVEEGCYAVHPSDTAPALIALDALIKTTERIIPAKDFFTVDVLKTTVLSLGEIVTEIQIPPTEGKNAFVKFALRKAIDFPIVNCAAAIDLSNQKITKARVCLNAVHVKPLRAIQAEEILMGKPLDSAAAEAAGAAAVSAARPLSGNAYMVRIAEAMVKRAVMGCI